MTLTSAASLTEAPPTTTKTVVKNPWPFLKGMFRYESGEIRLGKHDSFTFVCILCNKEGITKVVKAGRSSKSNLKKHLVTQHPGEVVKYNTLVTLKGVQATLVVDEFSQSVKDS